MKASKWPYRPDHITNDGETCDKKESLVALNGVGIISNEYLQGIEIATCIKRKCPLTIIEFSPEGKPVRTDPPQLGSTKQLIFSLHPTCRILHEKRPNGVQYCLKCDNAHAILFKGRTKADLHTEVNKEIDDMVATGEYVRKYGSTGLKPKIELVEDGDKIYLHYDCPLLGYREIIFPIFFEDRVIAVLFTGQICLEGNLDLIKEIQQNFFHKNNLIGTKVSKDISHEHEKWAKNKNNILSNNGYKSLINDMHEEIRRIEETLNEQMGLQREAYIKDKIDIRSKEFFKILPKKLSFRNDNLQLLWENVSARMEELLDDFNIMYAIVFGIKRTTQNITDKLEVVSYGGELTEEMKKSIEAGTLMFDLDKLPAGLHNARTNSNHHKQIFDGLAGFPNKPSDSMNLIRMFPIPFLNTGPVVILLGYYEDNLLTSIENKPGGSLDRYIESFYNIVLSILSSILAETAQSNLRISLRVLGHEADQLTFGLEELRKNYLSDARTLKSLPNQKIDDICLDIEGFFGQLNLLFKQAMITTGELPPLRKESFWAYKEILFKWQDIYRLEAEHRKLKFDIFKTWKDDPDRPAVYGDKTRLEQLVYNLVSNAVKYCYPGTKIRLDCLKSGTNKNSPHILTVTNYGRELKCVNPFELFTRGENVRGIEGVGIGMYNAKKIANAHNALLEYDYEKISDFNVVLIKPYIRENFKGKDLSLVKQLEDELRRLDVSKEYDKIVAYNENGLPLYNPQKHELLDLIRKPTWKITFTLTIPAKGEIL